MPILRKSVLAAAAMVGTASLATALAAPAMATVTGFGFGMGSTALQAKSAATTDLLSNYFGCKNIVLVSDVQTVHGSWEAEVTASCQGIR